MSMADKIAIMEDGILQQVGSPDEVYDHPSNLFVAQFIGSPIMNILDCTLDSDENHTLCFLGEKESSMRFSKSLYKHIESKAVPNGKLALGVRPEAVRLTRQARENYLKSEVHVIEPLGPYDIVDLKISGQHMRVKAASNYIQKPGDAVWIQLDEKRTHFFDKESGRSLNF
jgi:multiple sugar transport system ATP-binding protein